MAVHFLTEKDLLDWLNNPEEGSAVLIKTPTCGKCKVIIQEMEEEEGKYRIAVFEFNPVEHRKIVENKIFQQLRSVPALLLGKAIIEENNPRIEVEIYPERFDHFKEIKHLLSVESPIEEPPTEEP